MKINDGEVWREIEGSEGRYEVSNLGRVWRNEYVATNGKIMKSEELTGRVTNYGYRSFNLKILGRPRNRLGHHLVLEAFVSPRPQGLITRHLDGDRLNNHVDNLKWGTYKENHNDSVKHGTAVYLTRDKATHCIRGHKYTDANTYKSSKAQTCRACHLAQTWARDNGEVFTVQLADSYFDKIHNTPTCRRGHELYDWARIGDTYSCRACKQAKEFAGYHKISLTQELADVYYKKLLDKSRGILDI